MKVLKKNLSVDKDSDNYAVSKKELTTSKGSKGGKISIKKQIESKTQCP